jgi:hypothetical protein
MTQDTEEHEIEVTSVREYEGTINSTSIREPDEYVDYGMRFNEETKRTYECVCGDKFRKEETAIEHLTNIENDN